MKELICKADIVEEIEKIYNEDYKFLPSDVVESVQDFKDNLLIALNTLEMKEVNLDREIRRYRMRNPIIQHKEESLYDYMTNVAKHFFELGIKSKGE